MVRRKFLLATIGIAVVAATVGFVTLASGATSTTGSSTTIDPTQATLAGPDDISGQPSPHAFVYRCLQENNDCTATEQAQAKQAAESSTTRPAPPDPTAVSETEALALVKDSPAIDRLERIDVRTTTWASFNAATPWSQHTRGDEGIIDTTVIRVVAVGGAVHVPAEFTPTSYNWMIVVIDAATGEHLATTMGDADGSWPPYFNDLVQAR